ncbi:phospho-2-dehydro-3-deoxyheptonate aldolase-like protein [Xylariomycetidae sp. FL0641]|nr:phospho-2-dehydro-3-deoxyheptonate aldolase-like protein [Xylariomycetidae sp. FL0641]
MAEAPHDTNGAKPASGAEWTPSSWRSKPIRQCPEYPDAAALKKATGELSSLPPIVHAHEIERLRASLRDVAQGKAFLLQGGDCAELFDYCRQDAIESKVKLLLQMSLVLIWGADKRVVRIGRMAGQYAKPRSSATEVVDGREVPSFRGDILNGFHLDERELDPQRLVKAYNHSAATLNYIRAAIAAGIADLHRPLNWSLGHIRDPDLSAKYTQAVRFLRDMLRFMHTIGADRSPKLDTVDLFTSHEGLLLEYEEALTRLQERPAGFSSLSDEDTSRPPSPGGNNTSEEPQKLYYDTSAHFLWIGDRTRQLDGAHVEFFRGVANPLGVKVGPTTPADDLLELLRALNPRREAGKVTLITRYGADKVRELLPGHIAAVEGSEYRGRVIWQCDPMHGNTRSVSSSSLPASATSDDEKKTTTIKTRRFGDIFAELQQTLQVHKEMGSYLGGVHLEMTGDAVTECMGGNEGLDADDLSTNYTSFCDPRLNEKQAIELAFLIADSYRKEREL